MLRDNFIGRSVAIGLAVLSMIAPANADSANEARVSLEALAQPSFIFERERTARPFAHVLFCNEQPTECLTSGTGLPVAMTAERFAELEGVNLGVNQRIRPVQDGATTMGADKWSLDPATGDCEDYAITKRRDLVDRGWPADTLRLASTRTAQGQDHMVLVVRTSLGDLVLDNLTNRVLPWQATGLRWKTIQSADPNKWFAV